jgi:hypothetical protein
VLGQFLDEVFIDTTVPVETGGQGVAIDEVNVLALDDLLVDGKRQVDAPALLRCHFLAAWEAASNLAVETCGCPLNLVRGGGGFFGPRVALR